MRRVHHLVLSLAAKLWLTAAALVVLLAVASTAVRWWLPLAVGQAEDLQQLLSDYAGRPVEVGQVQVRWWRWGPELTLHDVRVRSPDGHETVLRLQEARVAVNLIGSLLNQRFQPAAITILGGRLTVERLVGGGLRLAGFSAGAGPEMAGDEALSWFLDQDYVRLEQGELVWRDQRTDTTLRLTELNLSLFNDGNLHRLDGRGQLRGAESGSLRFGAELRGPASDLNRWQGASYLRAEGLPLPYLLGEVPGAPALAGGLLSTELWGRVQGGRLARLEGRLALVDLRLDGAAPPLALATALRFERDTETPTWSASLDGLSLSGVGERGPETALRARFRWGEGRWPELIEGRLDRLQLEALAPAAPLLPEKAAALLGEAAPRGLVEDLGFRVELPAEGPPRLAVSGRFSDLASAPVGRVPGMSGLSGTLVADSDGGRLSLHSQGVGAEFPQLFRAPLALHRLDGTLAWRREADGWNLWARGLTLGNADIQVSRVDLDLVLPADGSSPVLHLAAQYVDGDGSRVSPYLPAGIMPPGTVAWLDRALVGGRIPAGTLLVYGPLDRFPYKDGGGHFEVRTRVEDYVLDHTEGWPRIEGIRGEVDFIGQGMAIHADAGRIFQTTIEEATATIADLRGKPAVLEVEGRARGPGSDGLRYLRESPLSERFARYLTGAEVAGEVTLGLGVTLPLDPGHETKVRGDIGFSDNTVRFQGLDLTLDRASGHLAFTERALNGKALEARLLEQPVRLDVHTSDAGVEVQARGRMPLALLAAQYPTPVDRYLSGTAGYQARVALRADPRSTALGAQLTLSSDLKGVKVALPAPLGKNSAAAVPLELVVSLGESAERQIRLRYGDRLSAVLRLQPTATGLTVERGRLTVGGEAFLPREPGLVIDGRMERLVPDDWTALAAGSDTGTGAPLRRVALEVGHLAAVGQDFTDVGVVVVPAVGGGWQVRLASEALQGTLTVPEKGPWVAALQRLHLVAGGAGNAKGKPVDPRKLPPLNLSCAALRYGETDLGRLELEARSDAKGLVLQSLKLTGNHAVLTASGRWEAAAPQTVTIQGQLSSDDTGGTLKSFGFATGVDGGKARNDFDLHWPGGPGGFSVAGLGGTLHLRIDDGRLVDLKPGVGRLVGLLSVEALRRRLTLDFSDFFKQGFVFDRMEGRFTLDEGDAYTNDFYIHGPAARIDITGRVGLVAEDYDQQVTVTPAVGGSLAVGGAIAGGPIAGAAVLLLQKLFQPQIEQITRAEYRLTGSWSDPTLERIPRNEENSTPLSQEKR